MRPEYEQIELLYQAFTALDRDIDARPSVFTYGEAYKASLIAEPGEMFQGAHRIEALLYRDENVTAAIPWAEELVSDCQALVEVLQNPVNFSAAQVFHGLIELPFEVAYKKFSSEEETWSDLSMLIFFNNLQGIISIFKPWQEASQAAAQALNAMTAAEATFAAASAALAPYVVNNTGTGGRLTYAPYSSVPQSARSNITRAFYDVAVAMEQASEALGIEPLPEEDGEAEACTPTGLVTSFDASSPQISQGVEYFRALLPYSIKESQAFTALVAAGNIDAVKAAYVRTRPIYEQVEVLATSFVFADVALDAREYLFSRGELSDDFKGYHRLERLIFRDGNLSEATLQYAQGVEDSLADLQATFSDTSRTLWTAAKTFEGALNLASEVVAKKITSEEETSSDLSLMIFYNNWKGIYSQAVPFCSLAEAQCKAFTDAVVAAAACLGITTTDVITNVGASVVDDTFVAGLLDATYPPYSNASRDTRLCIIREGYRVRDALIEFANVLNVVDTCSPYHRSSFVYFPDGSAPPAAATEAAGASGSLTHVSWIALLVSHVAAFLILALR